MPIFYRGSGIDTYWYLNNPVEIGFIARAPNVEPTTARLMQHISRGTSNSPFISLTLSYAVARDYAILSSPEIPTPSKPAYVYEVEFQEPLPSGLKVLDPVKEVAQTLPSPSTIGPAYQHDGSPEFLLGIVDPRNMGHFLVRHSPQPPLSEGTLRTPNLTLELETFVRALRDAEILAYGTIPATCVVNCFDVYADSYLSQSITPR